MQRTLGFSTHKLSLEERLWLVNPENPESPFHDFVGNRDQIEPLWLSAADAYGNERHRCSEESFAIFGTPSTGKTKLVKCFANAVRLPFVEVQPQSLSTVGDLFNQIARVCEQTIAPDGQNLRLTPADPRKPHVLQLPCMVIFIDEVHTLKKSIMEALLKATEHDDRMLQTEKGWLIDTSFVCWIIATTDRGDLAEAFETRFTKIHLKPYSPQEIQQIVKMATPEWSDEICALATKFGGPVVREVLAFVRMMQKYQKTHPDMPLDEVANTVRIKKKIDEYGVSEQRINVLTALGQRPISEHRLALVAGCKLNELIKFILPPMLVPINEKDPLSAWLVMTSSGYSTTPAGLEELKKRGIENRGEKAFARDVLDLMGAI